MNRIWAPWRMEYITSTKEPGENKCFLCLTGDMDESSLVLLRKPAAFAIMNRYPYSNGHVMVVPTRHVGRIEELTDEELLDMMGLVRIVSTVFQEELSVDGLNVGINMGKAAGAGLEEHIHIHVVPRWFGDTNFMPVLGETRVISEHLLATYRKLKEKMRAKVL
ncbi:MAG: AP-4-A phosphorylase [Syntrophorhabdaceae bacterium PtaU1.Bin034]|jgi:ATP adenylyltransferase|nr:MAG: AP-4-A phosphorylase [Syntrophorhabdaceae bacterium PtaU1.Bin034]